MYEELSDNKRKVILCHYPIMCYNGQYKLNAEGNPKTYMLYGHVHDTQDQRLLERFQGITSETTFLNTQGETQHIPCNMINCFCMIFKLSASLTLVNGLRVIRTGNKRAARM